MIGLPTHTADKWCCLQKYHCRFVCKFILVINIVTFVSFVYTDAFVVFVVVFCLLLLLIPDLDYSVVPSFCGCTIVTPLLYLQSLIFSYFPFASDRSPALPVAPLSGPSRRIDFQFPVSNP